MPTGAPTATQPRSPPEATSTSRKGTTVTPGNGYRLARRRIMGLQRVEIEGVRLDNPDFPLVGSLGCMTEIVTHLNEQQGD